MYLLHCIYVHLHPKCKYTTTKSKHFHLVKMNSKPKNNTSTNINEGHVEIQLPPVWKMQKNLLQVMH